MTASKWGTSQWTALALTAPDGTNLTPTRLLAVAVVADRLLFLQHVGSASTPPDPAAFTALFEDAFEVPAPRLIVPIQPRPGAPARPACVSKGVTLIPATAPLPCPGRH